MSQRGQTQVLILVGIVILIAVVGGIFFLGRVTVPKSQAPVATSSPQPSPTLSPTTTPDPTANWKTYTNTKYKYSIRVPQDYMIGECMDSIRIASTKQGIECQQGTSGLILSIYANADKISHLNAIRRDYSINEKEILISGVEGIQIEGILTDIAPAPAPDHIILSIFEKNNQSYLFEYYDYSKGQQSTLYSQILSTFRFTN